MASSGSDFDSFKAELSPAGLQVLEELGARLALVVSTKLGGKFDLPALTRSVSAGMPFLKADEARAITIVAAAMMPQQDNAQMMKVQMAMQRENMVFTSVSNVLKTRHDTAKNSIGNVR